MSPVLKSGLEIGIGMELPSPTIPVKADKSLQPKNREDVKNKILIGFSLVAIGCCALTGLSYYLQNYLKIH